MNKIRLIELIKINGDPLIYGEELDMLSVTFMYNEKEYKALQPYEDISTEEKLQGFIEKVIEKIPSSVPDKKTENLSIFIKREEIE